MLRLTRMKAASRKNMMSMSGMISIRASALSVGSLLFNLTGIGGLLAEGAIARKFLKVVPVMFGRFNEQLNVIDRALQGGAKMGQLAVEIVVGQQAEDRDPQSAG